MQYRLRRADGTYVPVLDRAFLVCDPSGHPARVVGSLIDMTERLRYEADLEQARREAQEASRAKSEFLAKMGHEIRTPMNGGIGMTEMLLSTELSQTQRQYAITVRQSGERLLRIVDDVLDFSKIEAHAMTLELAPVDLRSLVAECLASVEVAACAKAVPLRSEVAADLRDPVLTDRRSPSVSPCRFAGFAGFARGRRYEHRVTSDADCRRRRNGHWSPATEPARRPPRASAHPQAGRCA